MRKKRNSVIVLLILSATMFIPTISLTLASMRIYSHPTIFFYYGDPRQPIGPVAVLFLLFAGLEIIFEFIWCPFRRWTISSCRDANCSLRKLCKDCDIRISLRQKYLVPVQEMSENQYIVRICEKCEIVLSGLISLLALACLAAWEYFILLG